MVRQATVAAGGRSRRGVSRVMNATSAHRLAAQVRVDTRIAAASCLSAAHRCLEAPSSRHNNLAERWDKEVHLKRSSAAPRPSPLLRISNRS